MKQYLLALVAVGAIVAGFLYSTNRLSEAIHQSETKAAPVNAPDPGAQKALAEQRAAMHAAQLKLLEAQADEAKARTYAQLAYGHSLVKPAEPEPTPVPKVTPAYSIAGKPRLGAKVYGNPKRDTSAPHVIVDFAPGSAIDWEAAVKSGRCVGFSFVKAGETKRTNRLWCDKVVAR